MRTILAKIIFLFLLLPSSFAFAKSTLHYMCGLNGILGASTIYNELKEVSGSATTKSTYRDYWGPGLGVFCELGRIEKDSANFSLGFEYDAERSSVSFSKTDKATNTNSSGTLNKVNAPKIQSNDVYFNGVFRWDRGGYLIFGLNYSLHNYKLPPGTDGTVDIKGGLGGQFGAGILFWDDQMSFEILNKYRFYNLHVVDTTNQVDADYGQGFYNQLSLNLKVIF